MSCKAVIEPLAPVRGGVGVTERGLHPELSVTHLDREGVCVRPEIESAAAFEVEAGVVPMTGQDFRARRGPRSEWEAHVRARLSRATTTRPRSQTTRIGRWALCTTTCPSPSACRGSLQAFARARTNMAAGRSPSATGSRYLDWLIDPCPQDRETYAKCSPINHVDRFSAPVIFFQGRDGLRELGAQSAWLVALRLPLVANGSALCVGRFERQWRGHSIGTVKCPQSRRVSDAGLGAGADAGVRPFGRRPKASKGGTAGRKGRWRGEGADLWGFCDGSGGGLRRRGAFSRRTRAAAAFGTGGLTSEGGAPDRIKLGTLTYRYSNRFFRRAYVLARPSHRPQPVCSAAEGSFPVNSGQAARPERPIVQFPFQPPRPRISICRQYPWTPRY